MNVLREVDLMPQRSITNIAKVTYEFTDEQFKQLLETVRQTTIEELNKKGSTDKFLTREEAARYLRIEPATLDRRLKSGKFPLSLRHVVGGSILFSQADLEKFIKES